MYFLQEFAETCLHHAISHETGNSLHMVDFLVQNSSSLDRQTREGNTPLHYCVIQNQSESMRLLLRSGANPAVENNNGKTPVDIAKERGHTLCEEMVRIKESIIHMYSLASNGWPNGYSTVYTLKWPSIGSQSVTCTAVIT